MSKQLTFSWARIILSLIIANSVNFGFADYAQAAGKSSKTKKLSVAEKRKIASDRKAKQESDLKSIQREIEAGRKEIDLELEAKDEAEKENVELTRKIEKARADRDELKREYTAIKTDEKKTRTHIANLKKQDEKEQAEYTKLLKTNDSSKKDFEKIQNQRQSQESILARTQEANEKIRKSLAESKELKIKYMNTISENESERKKLMADSEVAKKETAALKAQIETLKIKLRDAQKTKSLSAGAYKSVAAEANKWKAFNRGEEQKVQKIEDEVTDLQRMIKAGQQEIERAREQNQDLMKRKNNASVSIPKYQAQLNKLKTEYRLLQERNRSLASR